MDQQQRTWLLKMIEDARGLVTQERKNLKLKLEKLYGEKDEKVSQIKFEGKEFEAAVSEKYRTMVIEMEWRKRNKARVESEQEKKQHLKQKELEGEIKKRKKQEADWEKNRDARVASWRDFKNKKARVKK
ncbi:hypothetical protein AX774_g5060 [Zancudomyces culisetae]|uniref:Uncharacterized protein n=1 Tax=Zancudomyces culisetae TaxID=1213189 RepID=A0A1R1PKK1_ZANCU|nr:hypothetical protein AX774_g5060 [Zancudomyces culisetae]|eukprot:OMH81484.1 hypothetical protein AX774_g5060 [Zancudomyces culisetae]